MQNYKSTRPFSASMLIEELINPEDNPALSTLYLDVRERHGEKAYKQLEAADLGLIMQHIPQEKPVFAWTRNDERTYEVRASSGTLIGYHCKASVLHLNNLCNVFLPTDRGYELVITLLLSKAPEKISEE